jgi:hypothetical protein
MRYLTCSRVFFDSGALHHSYINKDIVEKHRLKWAKYIRPYEAWVRLADQKTVIKTREIVRGVLSFVSDGGTDFSGEVDAIVWDMRGLDFILGLPDIVRNFITLFFLMLKQYQLDLCAVSTQETVLESSMKPGEVMHWSEQLDQEAEEESQCPMPTASAPMLAFLETSHEEAMKIYKDSLDAHIGPRLAKSKAFRDILESDLAVKRFVPDEWLGLNIPPLKLEVRDSLPEAHPVHSRPINPKLWDVARKEFDRLKGYNYTPSKSLWASPLVTASKATTPFIRFCGDYQWLNPHLVMPQAYIPRVQYEELEHLAAGYSPSNVANDLTNESSCQFEPGEGGVISCPDSSSMLCSLRVSLDESVERVSVSSAACRHLRSSKVSVVYRVKNPVGPLQSVYSVLPLGVGGCTVEEDQRWVFDPGGTLQRVVSVQGCMPSVAQGAAIVCGLRRSDVLGSDEFEFGVNMYFISVPYNRMVMLQVCL